MQFVPITTAREVSIKLDPLQDQLQRIYDNQGIELYDESKGNVKIEDVRAATLMTCKADIMNNILILNLLATVKEGKIPEKTWRILIGLTNESIQLDYIERNLAQYLRLSLVTMVQFRIENLIVNLLDCLDSKKITRRYLKNAENLLNIVTVQNKNERLNILKVLQHIRNSLHSNGVHNNESMSISIKGHDFDFQNGQKVQSASWSHIIVALEVTFEVLEEILNSPEVKAIPQPIRDHYIEQT